MDANHLESKKLTSRRDKDEILQQSNLFLNSYLEEILNSLPNIGFIVNRERQIVFANQALLDMLGMNNIDEALGARPGEIMKCVNSQDTIHGCGTGEACRYCGCVYVVLASQKQQRRITGECRINSVIENDLISFNLSVTAQPLDFNGEQFVMVFILDISNQKRRELLERIFLHDIINTITTLMSTVELFPKENLNHTQKDYINKIQKLTNFIVEEIRAQRDLLDIESSNYIAIFKLVEPKELINSIVESIRKTSIAQEKIIKVNGIPSIEFETDQRLLRRVLFNLIKNALEASKRGEKIEIGSYEEKPHIYFYVRNPAVMSIEVRHQIFQRAFSTKGVGRGIGTYSVKLLTEKYLGGKVSFTTTKKDGTTFFIKLPIKTSD